MKYLRALLVVCSLAATAIPSALAQPANDNFASAWALSGTSLITNGTTSAASKEAGEPNHAGNTGGRSVWFTWTPSASTTVRLVATNTSFVTLLAVYTGNAVNALSPVVSRQGDFNFGQPIPTNMVQFEAVQGTPYRIAVDARRFGGGTPGGGTYNLILQVLGSSVITSPANNAVFAVGTPIPITAEASVPGATISRIDFLRNGALIGTDNTAPFSMVYSNPPQGSNTLTAVAVDSSGGSWNSPPVNIAVLANGVTITAPPDGASFLATNPIGVTAVGLLPSGSITNVDFLVDGTKFGQATAAPFTATWSPVTPGPHQFLAVGKGTDGLTYNSAPSYIAVARSLIASNAVWTYLDNNTDPGAGWTTVAYDDGGWVGSGPAPLGYGDSNGRAVATATSFGPDSANKYITTYFRRRFTIDNPANFTNLFLRYERDDGVVLYLNGVEIGRNSMPAGTILPSTLATAQNDDGVAVFTLNVPSSLLVAGTNVLAAEVHQDGPTSSDIWFVLEALGVPSIQRNQPPTVALTAPSNNAIYAGPASLLLAATASDADVGGSVTKVEFLVDGAKIGQATAAPYQFTWASPSVGWHTVQAVATDDQGASTASALANVTILDAFASPLVELLAPAHGASFDGPTNLLLSARAATFEGPGTFSVSFLTNGVLMATDATAPFSTIWTNATFGTNRIAAMVTDELGGMVTSAVATIVVVPPPPNLAAPTIASLNPAPASNLTNFTSLQVLFSERVIGVDAADLLVNGVPATGVSGTTSNYTFTFPQPAVGEVEVTWVASPGIQDVGYPPLPFVVPAAVAYNLIDAVPPTILARNPAAGATVTNLTSVAVTFSEPVNGVGAADFLVNGTPAVGLSSVGSSNFTFTFPQPTGPTVNITWAAGHGITDQSATPNAFNPTGAGATWSYTLDNRTVLVQSNALWRFQKGLAEVSSPISLWRTNGYDDSGWSNAAAPFYYGDAVYASTANPGTLLSDMQGGYSSVFLRRTFFLPTASAATNLYLAAYIDDGMVIWINGVEVLRLNMAAGEVAYNSTAPTSANEPGNNGIPYTVYTLPNPAGYLVDGTNTITVQGFNNSPATSTDFGFNGQLYTFLLDPSLVAPTVSSLSPAAGDVFVLTNITVRFSEPVTGVEAADLRINGVPATGMTSPTNTTYTFSFAQPPYGTVNVTWDAAAGIADLDAPPKPFNPAGGGASFSYNLVNPSAPTLVGQTPAAGGSVTQLTQVTVVFSEPVTGVDAADLLVNLIPATGLSGSGTTYTFTFPQPAYGAVSFAWSASHGITDLETPANPFNPARPGSTWSYTLVDQIPPVIAAKSPVAGATVTNLTAITVTFSEAVAGVNASDLLLNGVPATGLAGGPTAYTFSFTTPNATVINVTWATTHGIRDLATVPNAFNPTGPGATWSYLTPDTVAPTLANIDPPAGVTVRSLNQIRLTFTEPVTGLDTNDLLINNRKPHLLTGSGAGPYTFTLLPPSNGPVDVRFSVTNGITDLATPPNSFPGAEWTYTYDPNAAFAGKVVISEIMYNPLGGAPTNEWIELRNLSTNLINLTAWRLSRGVNYTFPNVAIPAGGHLVVAASLPAFQARYPGVTNVVGGWNGSLANGGETVELETSLGEKVNSVRYAKEGDWGRRERGAGVSLVGSLTRNGTTVTVTLFAHGYTANDQVVISGADQPEYNGRFVVGGVTPSTFTYTIAGSPATPATGTIVSRQVIDDSSSGWTWFSAADGFGSSLELVNPALPGDSGQNWASSAAPGGTPGALNGAQTNNIAPLITEAVHTPAIPRSTDPVTLSARVRDELSNGVASVSLFYRTHTAASPGAFTSVPMLDNGASGDGAANDGLYGAILPAAAAGTVIEFYLQATDTSGRSRTWPAPTLDTNGVSGQLANALYQVDNESITNVMPAVRVVLTGTEQSFLQQSGTINSDAAMNLTLITTDAEGTKIRYTASARIRGAGSRGRNPKNNRIDIPGDNPWNGLTSINLNGLYPHAQVLGNNLAIRSGVAAEFARVIQYRINGVNPAPLPAPGVGGTPYGGYGTYVLLVPPGGDLASDLFPNDGDGNYYRASIAAHSADLSYQGGVPNNWLARGYYKTSNRTENDWSDFAALTFAFEQVANDADYVTAISTNVNVAEWMRYFAIGSLMNYGETALHNGRGDDYALYRGMVDRRFQLVSHDFDTIFGQGDATASYYPVSTNASIFITLNPPNNNANVPLLRRFMTNAAFAPVFYQELKKLCDTTFHPTNLNPYIQQMLGGWGNGPTATTISDIQTYANNRRLVALSQIPLNLTVVHGLSLSNGFPYTTSPTVAMGGFANAIDTRRVLVNGTAATWDAYAARWTNSTPLQPGINRVLIQSLNSNNVEFARTTVEIWYEDGSVQTVSGTIAADTTWSAAAGPYQVTGSLTVASGVTLTITPGTTIYLAGGVNLAVASGGRLLAEGTDTAGIRFTRVPGGANWGGLTINGAAGTPETRLAYVHFEGNGVTAIDVNAGDLFLSHATFGNTGVQYLSLDGASFVIEDCIFPATTASFEPTHGTAGIKAGGRGIVRRCYWGRVNGYNDAFDFTGGNRPGPILQVLNCVFAGSDDDLLDLDSTDAWIEGNIFMHCHRSGSSPDSSSAVSGGSDNAENSQVTILGNLFYDCDQTANAKQTNFYTMLHNTIVRQSRVGSLDTNAGVVILADDTTSQGRGIYLEGNIISDAENLTRNVTTALVTYTNNLIYQLQGAPWTGPGGNNTTADPLFTYVPQLSETTNFTSWDAAQVMWQWFSLRPGSPAIGTGIGGRDKGAVAPGGTGPVRGAILAGAPVGVTPATTALLRVEPRITGGGTPTNGYPNGSGFTHYKWRLDAGPWSAETPAGIPIALTGLGNGPHFVEVVGRNDAGFYQDDPVFGADAVVTLSRTWTVNTSLPGLRLNEVLAANAGAFIHSNTAPDAIELHNLTGNALDLTGFRLTDDPDNPSKFIFPAGATLPAGGYLTVFANNPDGTPGYHLGFNLAQGGDALYLYAAADYGGALVDSVTFGLQLDNLSIGRLADGSWGLTVPTFGSANRGAAIGNPAQLRLNEWLAAGTIPYADDFVELYNGGPDPVALGGLYLSDEPMGWPDRHRITPLSFLGGYGYLAFLADGSPGAGANHLNFTLSPDQGALGLFAADLSVLDAVGYQAQFLNRSQGRSPNGSQTISYLSTPTPGAPNPLYVGPEPNGNALVINEVLANNASLAEGGRTPDWIEIYNGSTAPADLGDMSLTDDTLQPRRYVFPLGTSVAPGEFLRILCDPGSSASGSGVNTNFALKSTGGGLFLFDKPSRGGSLSNALVYGLQIPNLSIGRVPDGSTNWVLTAPTPLSANVAITTLGNPANLKVNEWMADAGPGKDDWFEIYNPNTLPVALSGLYLTDNLGNPLKYPIPALSFLGTGTNGYQKFIADNNPGAGADHVNFSLNAITEAVGLSTASGALISGFAYGVQLPGVSQGAFPDGSTNIVSFPGTDSPGESNWRWLTNVVVNEALTHTDLPLEDAIELRNLGAAPVDVGGWWLSDDNGTLQKYQIPSPTVIPPGGFAVVYETSFTNRAIATVPFALGSDGDEIVLSAASGGALTGFRTRVKFGAAANAVSFGRYVTSDGREEFTAMSARSFGVDDPGTVDQFRTGTGAPNPYPKVGPVIISEIHYHPPDLGTNDNALDEFIELRNISTVPVPLFDLTNTWRLRDAVDFNFPPGLTLPAGGELIVVGFDPVNDPAALAAFRVKFGMAPTTLVLGPWSGRLANVDEDIELRRPDAPNTNGVPYLLVEHVHYYDLAPWPALADGTGLSLHRVAASGFGNDPTNWVAAAPSPGPAPSAGADSDGDGMPDTWELAYSLDPLNPADANLDSDGDGLTNRQEFQVGTNPRDAQSALRFNAITRFGTNYILTFDAAANVPYVLQAAPNPVPPWATFQAVSPAPTNRVIQVLVVPGTLPQFFRLRVDP